ncbi:MAG TPA: hypothetical protein VLO07_00975, partial [Thermoanaerobaculia bacterium]|nr:hypothetical protein [Thermoanaerobaculia bacterium]
PTAPAGTNPVQVRLSTANPNPVAPSCTPIQATVTSNGANVGTAVTLSTSLGTFGQTGPAVMTVTAPSGVVNTSLCSNSAGAAAVSASAAVGNQTGSATLSVTFH